MKRFKPSRKEKLLFATPLLLPLLVLAWPLVATDSLDRTLHELAGPEAIDCGFSRFGSPFNDMCAIAAIKAGEPFMLRYRPNDFDMGPPGEQIGMVRTPKGEVYMVRYARLRWTEKAVLETGQCPNARVVPQIEKSLGAEAISCGRDENPAISTRVWW